MSPEKTKEKIDSLNEKINKWEGKSESLGDIVKGLKGGCLAAGAVLTVKNLYENLDGKAIARQNVMRGAEGFYEQCEKNVGDGKQYKSVEECLLDKSDEIDKQVEEMNQLITSQNNELKLVDESCKIDTSWEFITEKQVNTSCFKEKYLGTSKDDLKKLSPVTCGSDNVEINSFVDGLKSEQVSSEELRDLALYASAGDSLSSIAKARSKSIICDIYARTKNSVAVDGFANQLGISSSDVNFVFRKDAKELLYTGKTYKDIKNKYPSLVKDLGDTAVPINDSTPVSTILTSDGKKYVAVWKKMEINTRLKKMDFMILTALVLKTMN